MIKSIKIKLWLTLFITLVISLGGLLGLTYFNVKQRFLDYATNQILERLAPLEEAVVNLYAESNSLGAFHEEPARWTQLRDASYRQYLQDQKRRSAQPVGPPSQDWSEKESIEKKLQPNQRAFFQHLVLYDAQKTLVAGRPQGDSNYIFRPLTLNNQTIAFIGYIKPKAFLRSVDKLFVDQQLHLFAALSVLMVLAALVVTLGLSRWLVAPLSLLSRSAQRVTKGDFSVRVNVAGDDELGQLCQNFDDMTHTLEKNEVMRKQWVADISHEMRTPLSVLKAQIEAMEDGIRPANTDSFRLLRRNVDSLSTVIDDLYELSLADLGELTLHPEQLDLNELVHEVASAFEDKFLQKNLSFEFTPRRDTAVANFDKQRLKQVVTNLLENSYRYTNDGGLVRVMLEMKPDYITLKIEDSAPGVPEESLPHLYDRLFRVESSRNRETGGAGLGLSICKGIIEAHGGNMKATRSDLGGLSQIIRIPI